MQTYALLFHMCFCYTSDAYVKYSFSMYLNVICSFQFYPTSSHPLNEVNGVSASAWWLVEELSVCQRMQGALGWQNNNFTWLIINCYIWLILISSEIISSSRLKCSLVFPQICAEDRSYRSTYEWTMGDIFRDFRFLTVTDLSYSFRDYRKKYTFCYFLAGCGILKGIIITLYPLSKYRTGEFVPCVHCWPSELSDTGSLMNE